MARRKSVLSQVDRDRINDALSEAAKTTSVRIVPVVANSSARYDRAEDMLGMWAAALGLAVLWALFSSLPMAHALAGGGSVGQGAYLRVMLVLILGFVGGGLLGTQIRYLRRLFVPRSRMQQAVLTRAQMVYHNYRAHHGRSDNVLLVYVSLYEKSVAIVNDERLDEVLSLDDLKHIRRPAAVALHRGRVSEGLCDTIMRAAKALGIHLPARADAEYVASLKVLEESFDGSQAAPAAQQGQD